MKYSEFREKVSQYPFFYSHLFGQLTADVPTLRNQIVDWSKKGWVIPLKRGMYTLRESDRTAVFSPYFLANHLYTPSYISLESALSYYGLIPEGVYSVISVSSKKTQQYTNAYGTFSYAHVKTALYEYRVAVKDEFGHTIMMATPEKAIFDFFYLRADAKQLAQASTDIFDLSWRFQNVNTVDKNKLMEMSSQLGVARVSRWIALLIEWMDKHA